MSEFYPIIVPMLAAMACLFLAVKGVSTSLDAQRKNSK